MGSQAAGNETALSQSGNGLAPIGVKQADEEMEQRYAKREDNQISPQSYVSEYQIYSEIERRVKDSMLSGQTTVDISDMNIYETKCVFPYYYGYSPYFPEGSFVALYYAEDGLYVEADIQNPYPQPIKESHLLLFDNGSYNDPTWYNCCSNVIGLYRIDTFHHSPFLTSGLRCFIWYYAE